MIELKNVSFGYSQNAIVSNINLMVYESETCAIYGKSGSGKSSLLNLIAGILKPTSGEINYSGCRIDNLSEVARDSYRKSNVGLVFQSFHLISSLTILENILLTQKLAVGKIDNKQAMQLLDRLDIAAHSHKLPSKLSVGQKQRAAIARAVINKPKLLLADEPTSSLDDDNATNIINLLFSLSRENGLALIVATHDSRIKNLFDKTLTLGVL